MGYMIYRISVFESDIQHSIEHTYKKNMYLYGESGALKYGKYGDDPGALISLNILPHSDRI